MLNPVSSKDFALSARSNLQYYHANETETLLLPVNRTGYYFVINVSLKGEITLLRPIGVETDPSELALDASRIIERALISYDGNTPMVSRENMIRMPDTGIEPMLAVFISDHETASQFIELLKNGRTLNLNDVFRTVQKWMVSNVFKGSQTHVRVAVRNLVVVR